MEYCQQNLPTSACISMNVMAYAPAVIYLISSILITKKKSFIFQMKSKQEYEENLSIIERSSFTRMVKQILTLINCMVCCVFIAIYVQEPTISIIVLAFYSIQTAIYILCVFLMSAEYKRQGKTSKILILNYALNFLFQAGVGVLFQLEHSIDTHCFGLLIILQVTSFISILSLVFLRNDFTKEAIQIQINIMKQVENRQQIITNNLLEQPVDQESISIKSQKVATQNITATSINSKQQFSDTHSFKDLNIADNSNSSQYDQVSMKRQTSALNTSTRSDGQDIRDILNARCTPSFSQHVNYSTFSNQEEEPKTYLYAYRDIKVVGYKAKNQHMQFVIEYFRGIKKLRTYRTHRDFKHLNKKMSEELFRSSLSLPLLPQRIQKTGTLDKNFMNDKVVKYNRFLNYIEYNKIESKEFTNFLLPITELAVYAPPSEKREEDSESFISNQSPPENMSRTDSIKNDEKTQNTNMPVSPSQFSRQRVSSDASFRGKSNTIYIINEDKADSLQASKESETQQKEVSSSIQEKQFLLIENNIEDFAKKEVGKESKESTLSNSTQASLQTQRLRSSTIQNNSNKSQDKCVAEQSGQRKAHEESLFTQSEQASFDSGYDQEERQGSTHSDGQEYGSILQNNTSKQRISLRGNTLLSNSQIETQPKSKNTNAQRDEAFSFSQQNESAENVFKKQNTGVSDELKIIINQHKEINGKTFYEILFFKNGKQLHNIDKRYNDFKEFHLTMKSQLKKSNLVNLLPQLPYKPKNSQNLVDFRKQNLAKYLTELKNIPVISNSELFQNFTEISI
ncbi:PX domain protein (macronuclear) [Tetrahymena thermophila SB210]|uniref:PX domain protein n=1 Tax=Tetrahymena thermophila (strain SB210) TaxID=312017 RepID=I7LTL9_TETTS|nr:PX domain protein [Tetrahymena thermophila SB210]EAR85488.3 PX domain protein [Tetrahymena thermophila SB210]|eukprot:XP_001033151.3 PX domain protein [Tetrahymena thermophila SB210]